MLVFIDESADAGFQIRATRDCTVVPSGPTNWSWLVGEARPRRLGVTLVNEGELERLKIVGVVDHPPQTPRLPHYID